MTALNLKQIGNSVGVTFPKELLARLRVELGDTLYLTEAPDGYRLTPFQPDFDMQLEAARRVMRKRRDALRELAK